ncbi:unnamed protein product [Oncorhynchus mykiss]|uniref:C6H2-type domain-containing protein n=1 Tax=Oncorhynchus mykiss TaxID=8022 RepID=A0A060VMI7_ONCMY|nr:unnamed protein product [Oncorhynchus mykiss]
MSIYGIVVAAILEFLSGDVPAKGNTYLPLARFSPADRPSTPPSLHPSRLQAGMAAIETRECETEGCSSEAKLQCPTCIKLGIQGSYFCSQECFKGSWATHKQMHKKAKEDKNQDEAKNCVENDTNTDPWPGYRYTGRLRPHYPLTPMRHVPGNIERPDYADHPLGNATPPRLPPVAFKF